MSAKYEKPLPRFHNRYAKDFYDGCKRSVLLIQRCKDCGKFRFPPQPMCPHCNSLQQEWAPVSGRGKVYTFTVIPGFQPRAVPMATWPADGYPINVALIELPDANGVHIVSNVIGCDAKDIKAGMPVQVVFDKVTDEITLPKFRPA